MKKVIIISILAITIMPGGGCMDCGASDFAKIYPGARGSGIGNSGVVTIEPASIELNPAALCFIEGSNAAFSQISYFESISLGYAALQMPSGPVSLGFSILSMDMPEFQGYDDWGFKTKKIKSSGSVFSAALAFPRGKINPDGGGISFGLGGKYISERLDLNEVAFSAASAGIFFRTLLFENEFASGVSATNLFNGGFFPAEANAGVSYALPVLGRKLYAALKVSFPESGSYAASASGIGAEYQIIKNMALRCGVSAIQRNEIVYETMWGIGLKLSGFLFEFSGANVSEPGPVYRFSIKTSLWNEKEDETSADESFEKGTDLYNEDRFAEAMLEFNNVLEKDPLNKEALEMLKKSFERIK